MTQGTREWADSNVNIAYGCSNNCIYCYAKGMAKRFRKEDYENWSNMRLNLEALAKNYRKRNGRIMFPTSHDITAEIREPAMIVLRKLLEAGNEILITSKPVPSIIEEICDRFDKYKEQVQFRFTLTSSSLQRSLVWEPNAPTPRNRFQSLERAYLFDWKTSVSIEPFLDPIELVPDWIKMLENNVSETIWIGPMNKKFCPPELWDESKWGVNAIRTLDQLIVQDQELDKSKIRYKDSFREALA